MYPDIRLKWRMFALVFTWLTVFMPLVMILGLNLILEAGGYPKIAYNFWSWAGVWLIMLATKSGGSFK